MLDMQELSALMGEEDAEEYEILAHVIIKRRGSGPSPEPEPEPEPGSTWTMLKHNAFDTYTQYVDTGGNRWTVLQNGEAAECISNGQNLNRSEFYIRDRFTYADIKDRTCRITWTVESDDIETMDKTNSFGNIQLLLLTNQTQTGGTTKEYRKAKVDIATEANFLGHHVLEFVPSQLFAGQQTGPYLGWNLGYRTNVSGQKVTLTQLDFELLEEDA